MNRTRIAVLLTAFIILAFGATQVGAQGPVTLESILKRLQFVEKRVDTLSEKQWEQGGQIGLVKTRIAKIETELNQLSVASPPTKTPIPRRTPRPTPFPSLTPTPPPTTQAGATQRARFNARATERAQASKPISTPRPPDRTSDQAYRTEVLHILIGDGSGRDVTTALATMGDALVRAGQNPALFFDDNWKGEIEVAVASLRQSFIDAKKLNPPKALDGFHHYLIEGLAYCDQASDKVVQGIDNLDADLFLEGNDLITLCGAMIQRASAEPNW